MEYIKRNKSEVPSGVIENIKNYLERNNLGEFIKAVRMSDHPDDSFLYGVIAKKNDDYSCWTCWNETTQTLNYGHYNMVSEEVCSEILMENFHRIYGVNVID